MRSYCKVYSDEFQSYISETPTPPATIPKMARFVPLGQRTKHWAVNTFNNLAGIWVPEPARSRLVWYLIDTTTGSPPGGGTIVTSFSALQMAQGLVFLYEYRFHPKS